MTHLNKISKIYKDCIAEKKDDSYLETDMKKRQANNEKARKDMEKMGTKMKNPHFEEKDPFGRPGGKYGGVPKKGSSYDKAFKANMKKLKELERAKVKEALDPVGQEDGDINNDGKKDKTDKYLMNRRKKIGKAIAATEAVDKRDEAAMKKFQELQKKVDQKKKLKKEEFSDWRADLQEQGLIEVMDETEADKPIKEKKVNNKVKINPKLGEAIEEIGGTLVEESEIDEVIESIYIELIEEGYSEDDVEEAIEFALIEELNEVSDRYYDSAVKASKEAAAKKRREEMMNKAKGRLRFMKRKAGEVVGNLKKKAADKAVDVAFAGSAAKDKVKTAMSTAKKRVTDAPKIAKKSIKDRIKQGALAVAKRMSEESEIDEEKQKLPYVKMFRKAGNLGRDGSPEAMERSKKITGVMNKNAERVAAHRERDDAAKDAKAAKKAKMKEELSIADQMRISRDAAKDRKPFDPEARQKQRAAQMRNAAKKAKKDTRTDAEKMADAYASPRKGPGGATRAD